MSLATFVNAEAEYLAWLQANPNGFVVNADRRPSSEYLVLHRATCTSISTYVGKVTLGAFTERNYSKTCSTDLGQLRAWVLALGSPKFTSVCSRCLTGTLINRDARGIEQAKFEAKVRAAMLQHARRRARLKSANPTPTIRTVVTTVFDRNPDVVAEVLFRAAGICECCKKAAPFNRSSDGMPYLEVHHIIPLANGGDDTVANAQAQCPNCHRQAHYG